MYRVTAIIFRVEPKPPIAAPTWLDMLEDARKGAISRRESEPEPVFVDEYTFDEYTYDGWEV